MKRQKAQWVLIPFFLVPAATLVLFWGQEGCKGNYPPIPVIVATSTPTLQPYVISNFNSDSVTVNSTLLNVDGHPGDFSVNTYGGSPANTIDNPFLFQNPGDGSNFAAHIYCALSDPPVTTISGGVTTVSSAYPADDLICTLVSGGSSPYFDASSFSGIQFEINILPDDTNSYRVFQVAVDVTTPTSTPGGTCTSGCYNYSQAVLPAGSTGGWVTESYMWSSITYPGFGTNNGPISNFLTKLIFLQWGFSDNGGLHNTNTDFWIDNVQFIP